MLCVTEFPRQLKTISSGRVNGIYPHDCYHGLSYPSLIVVAVAAAATVVAVVNAINLL